MISSKREDNAESWLAYYDIFVRHAFGSYRDILHEVSYSPLMGRFLTYLNNKAYDSSGRYPDENYARELMQLFTIGLWELNSDGTHKQRTADGASVPAYTDAHILSMARAWTGFTRASERGNVEAMYGPGRSPNVIDPMYIRAGESLSLSHTPFHPPPHVSHFPFLPPCWRPLS